MGGIGGPGRRQLAGPDQTPVGVSHRSRRFRAGLPTGRSRRRKPMRAWSAGGRSGPVGVRAESRRRPRPGGTPGPRSSRRLFPRGKIKGRKGRKPGQGRTWTKFAWSTYFEPGPRDAQPLQRLRLAAFVPPDPAGARLPSEWSALLSLPRLAPRPDAVGPAVAGGPVGPAQGVDHHPSAAGIYGDEASVPDIHTVVGGPRRVGGEQDPGPGTGPPQPRSAGGTVDGDPQARQREWAPTRTAVRPPAPPKPSRPSFATAPTRPCDALASAPSAASPSLLAHIPPSAYARELRKTAPNNGDKHLTFFAFSRNIAGETIKEG